MHGFAPALTSFVGRAAEIAEVADLLTGARLVTITGPGGVGKTRLAAEVVRQVTDRFADGAWLVELAGLQDPALVPATVAVVLGLRQEPGRSVTRSLAGAVARRQMLLVLDNCEHMLGAVATLCRELLTAADDLRVLATSREPAGVAGEVRYRLQPLAVSAAAVPPAGQVPPGANAPPGAEAGEAAAVVLFADRARQADPHFTVDAKAQPLVTEIVARLDGMPLAIELAAVRVEALGLAQLLDRLGNRFGILTSGDRMAAARQRSLAATVDWSYQLLGETGQRAFRQLSIFPGAFTLDGAVTVVGRDAEQTVLHLVDCSLLSPPRPGPDGRARYLMLETMRAFGLARLTETGEQPAAAAALARHALWVTEQSNAGMQTRAGEAAALRWLDAEDTTVHQALSWALDHDPDTALRLAVGLAQWWLSRSRSATGQALLKAAAAEAVPGSHEWCLALFWLGDIGNFTESLGYESAAYEALAARDPSPLLVDVLAGRSRTLMFLGRMPEAVADARNALDVARQIGYPAGEVLALAQLSRTAHFTGDATKALAWAREAERALAAGAPDWTTRLTGDFLADVLVESGDLAAARRHTAQALAMSMDSGDPYAKASALEHLADLDLREGQPAQAGARLREATELAVGVGNRARVCRCLDACGHLFVAGARWAEAVTIWTALKTVQEADGMIDVPLNAQRRHEPLRRAAQALGTDRTRAAEQRGAAMTLETAADFAIICTEAQQPTAAAPADVPRLSARERELVTLVAQGRTDAQIAGQLFISIRTVRSHLDRIRDKTGSRRRADLTRLALQAGLA